LSIFDAFWIFFQDIEPKLSLIFTILVKHMILFYLILFYLLTIALWQKCVIYFVEPVIATFNYILSSVLCIFLLYCTTGILLRWFSIRLVIKNRQSE